MVRTDNRANNDVRPLQVKWGYLKQQPASVLWQRGETKVLASAQFATGQPSLQLIGLGLSVSQITWLEAALQPNVQENALVVTLTVLEDDGGLLAEAFNAAIGAVTLLTSPTVDQALVCAVTVAWSAQQTTLVDPTLSEVQQAISQMTMVATSQEQVGALTLSGQPVDSAVFNDLILSASQGCTRTTAQFQASYQQAVKPIIKTAAETDTIVIATKNPGKAREFEAVFAADGLKVKTLLDYPELPEIAETGQTFEENARLKADQIAALLQLPVLADDSGLMVDALDGRPGIYSARFAGDHNDAGNNAKLLYELTGVPAEKRTATFHTTLVFAKPDRPNDDLIVEGNVQGRILGIPRGDNGFGYDPLFYIPELDASMAELTLAQKNQVSHRARAIANLEPVWREWLAD